MHLCLPFVPFLLLISLIHIPISSCQNQEYDKCAEVYRCNDIGFRYPFWSGEIRPDYCGYPGFEVTCDNPFPKITVSSITYRVLRSPDIREKTVQLARDDLADNSCAANDGDNTVFNPSMFSYTNTQNLTLLYTCPSLSSLPQNLNEFTCTENNAPTTNYFILTSQYPSIPDPPTCSHTITVPVERDFPAVVGTGALTASLMRGFPLGYRADNDNCDRCSRGNGQCGYNTPNKSFACYCRDGQDCYSKNSPEEGSGKTKQLIIGMSAAAAGLVMISMMIYCLAKRYSSCEEIFSWRSDDGSNQLVDEFMRNYGSIAPRLYTYAEIRKMTNSFSDKLGHGGYGSVYRGKLSDGREVAVKLLNDNKGNGEDFINEVAAISRTSHVNVVALLGFCCNGRKRALIYEFIPNGSLDKYIGWKESKHLEWKLLYEIAMGIARGLDYLHRGCNTRIVHLDIKPQNILLDADFHPKISDFGLAKLYKNKESVLSTMGARGTLGYIAPEMVFPSYGGVSHKSDVYSYGMMVLEMVGLTGKPEIDSQQTSEAYFPNWIHERVELGEEFPLKGVANEDEKESAMKMIYVGLWCIQPNPSERPSITKVVEMLEGSLDSLQIPPKPHLLSSAAMNFNQNSWTTSSFSV